MPAVCEKYLEVIGKPLLTAAQSSPTLHLAEKQKISIAVATLDTIVPLLQSTNELSDLNALFLT